MLLTDCMEFWVAFLVIIDGKFACHKKIVLVGEKKLARASNFLVHFFAFLARLRRKIAQ